MQFDLIKALPFILVILYLIFSLAFSRFNKFVIKRLYQDIKEPLLSDMVKVYQFLSLFYSGILTFISRLGSALGTNEDGFSIDAFGIIILTIILLFFIFVYIPLHKLVIKLFVIRVILTLILISINVYFIVSSQMIKT